MKVDHIEVFPIRYVEPNDNHSQRMTVLVRLRTDDGLEGWGEAIAMWPEACAAVKALIAGGLGTLVLGADPRHVEAIWQQMRAHAWWYGRGGIASFAISALDIALWDLKARALGVPLHEALGGAVHARLPAIASIHVTKGSAAAYGEEVAGYAAQGFRGLKMGMGKKGLSGLGVDPARDFDYVRAARDALGPERRLMVDVGNGVRWDPVHAIRMTRVFESCGIDWIEEPLHPDDIEGLRLMRGAVTTRLATGEREWSVEGYRRLLETGLVDVFGIDPGRAEGISGFRKSAELIGAARRVVNAHAWSTSVISAASLHLSLATPAAEVFEFKPLPGPAQYALVAAPIEPVDGYAVAPGGPGLGIDVRVEEVRRLVVA
jgi:L-alanine-DL-glutamate epimerase-like enolase superfamily enzyme